MLNSIHRIAIPSILDVGKNNLKNIGYLVNKNGFTKVGVFFGSGLFELFGKQVISSLTDNSVDIVYQQEIDTISMDDIVKQAFALSKDIEVIIGIGGGKVLDASKYMAFLRKIPFISVPTSTSNDGFSSSNASLIIGGKRTSVNAVMPYGIIVDVDVIRNAPEKFLFSGIGDLVSKITALYDWQFEEKMGKAIMDDFAVMISKKAVNSFVRTQFSTIKDDFFLKELVDSLTMSGIAMEIAGDSAPSSGSEHLISHALDSFCEKTQLHGIQVGVATYLMSKVQKHRYERITKVFISTGFFEHVKTLSMKKSDFEKAILMAPSIKPNRYTFLHVQKYRDLAIKLLYEDAILKNILV
ncbi:iron-containing alcohol dehydrogenase family protein [Clostridium oryzae]|uniref:Glycerol-1-phosphate dehydrogenase n=1 Tax=Clostridium oryzae TaxID=1450648 RepID=A0A1V4IQC8_9CLOT|nr:iron-containing alcohol dehydrogenase family protein [Clostridium oryzae]OPJ62228.1 glycerol-1-phosphate dehydrogenase [Clostridium oryzae]